MSRDEPSKMPYSVLRSLLVSLWDGRTKRDLEDNFDKIMAVQNYVLKTAGWTIEEYSRRFNVDR